MFFCIQQQTTTSRDNKDEGELNGTLMLYSSKHLMKEIPLNTNGYSDIPTKGWKNILHCSEFTSFYVVFYASYAFLHKETACMIRTDCSDVL